MLRPRIIPFLLLSNGGLYKTQKFSDPKYIGDPINAVKIYNEKEVDELVILDIHASSQGDEPNFELLQKISNESKMPLTYGGGIKNVEQAKKIINLGFEKISISSLIFERSDLINIISDTIGSQSLALVIDLKKIDNEYQIFINNGKDKCNLSLKELIKQLDNFNFGELIINSIDRDGTLEGMDKDLLELMKNYNNTQKSFVGGLSSEEEIFEIVTKYKLLGIGVGSLFVFKGPYKAVLISYLSKDIRDKIKILIDETV